LHVRWILSHLWVVKIKALIETVVVAVVLPRLPALRELALRGFGSLLLLLGEAVGELFELADLIVDRAELLGNLRFVSLPQALHRRGRVVEDARGIWILYQSLDAIGLGVQPLEGSLVPSILISERVKLLGVNVSRRLRSR
jgi:hypothetical protein